jgi:hypothetical protein
MGSPLCTNPALSEVEGCLVVIEFTNRISSRNFVAETVHKNYEYPM